VTTRRTFSYSGGNGRECLQVADKPSAGRVPVRDGKDLDCTILALKLAEWRRVTDHIRLSCQS
jgi:Domain of unknown function (DUF397)